MDELDIPKGYGMIITSPSGREMRLTKVEDRYGDNDRMLRKQAKAIKSWMRQERGIHY